MIRLKPPAAWSSERGRSEGEREAVERTGKEKERERMQRGRGESRGDLSAEGKAVWCGRGEASRSGHWERVKTRRNRFLVRRRKGGVTNESRRKYTK